MTDETKEPTLLEAIEALLASNARKEWEITGYVRGRWVCSDCRSSDLKDCAEPCLWLAVEKAAERENAKRKDAADIRVDEDGLCISCGRSVFGCSACDASNLLMEVECDELRTQLAEKEVECERLRAVSKSAIQQRDELRGELEVLRRAGGEHFARIAKTCGVEDWDHTHWLVAEIERRVAEKEAELRDIRMRLRGAPDSRLDSDGGLAAATMRELDTLQRELQVAGHNISSWKDTCSGLRLAMDAMTQQHAAETARVHELRGLLREALPHVVREHDSFVQFNEEPRPAAAALIERMRKAVGENG